MILSITDDFDPDKIADSGQCFRWYKTDERTWRILAGESCLYLTIPESDRYGPDRGSGPDSGLRCGPGSNPDFASDSGFDSDSDSVSDSGFDSNSDPGSGSDSDPDSGSDPGFVYDFECTGEEFDCFWRDYFDLKEDYQGIRGRINPEADPFLQQAAEHEKGIRILRQDPWEMLITFIISQNKNIPAIRRSVELLAERCGRKLLDSRGQVYYGFPGPEAVAALSGQDLQECRLGYRCKYVHAAARAVINGELDLDKLKEADEETTISALTGLFGVGIKVASCVSLFGLHHTDAFPVDVWMKRILAEHYPAGYPYERYSPYNGIYQQYMFAYYRHLQRFL